MNEVESTARYRNDQAKNLVGFLVGHVRYAVEIHRVREIVNPQMVVGLPHAPAEVVGVTDHRGQVLPVVDLRIRFGLPSAAATRRTKWLIVKMPTSPVAMVVDAVTEVFGAGEQQQRQVPDIGGGDDERGIMSVYAYGGGLTFVVDPERVADAAQKIQMPDLEQLAQMGEGE